MRSKLRAITAFDAEELGTLGRPVARRSRAVLLAANTTWACRRRC